MRLDSTLDAIYKVESRQIKTTVFSDEIVVSQTSLLQMFREDHNHCAVTNVNSASDVQTRQFLYVLIIFNLLNDQRYTILLCFIILLVSMLY